MIIDLRDIEVVVVRHEHEFDVNAFWRNRCVGYAWCNVIETRVKISDFKVTDEFRVPWPLLLGVLNWFGVSRGTMNLRNMGVGSAILSRVLSEAVSLGAHEVWGSVVAHDVRQNPRLLDWYRKRGFEIQEPDERCPKNVLKIVIKRIS